MNGKLAKKTPELSLSFEASSGARSNLPFCAPRAGRAPTTGLWSSRGNLSLLLPSDPPFTQRKKHGLNGWTLPKQECWELSGSNHALKIGYERATQCSRKNEPMRAAGTVKPTYYILLNISLMLTHAQCFLSLALGEILWRCFTLVRFMSLWPWECPWE